MSEFGALRRNIDTINNVGVDALDIEFGECVTLLNKLQHYKGKTYKLSCFQKGMLGLGFNIFRKMDRITNIHEDNPLVWDSPDLVKGEAWLDTIADAAVYLIKALNAYKFTHPELYKKFSDSVRELEGSFEGK